MIESSSRITGLLQNRKAVTLPVLYLLFALLFLFSSAGVFINDAGTNHGNSVSGNGGYLLTQKSDLTVSAHIIPFSVIPYPDNAIAAANSASGDPVDLVQKAYAAGKRALISAGNRHSEPDGPAFARNLVAFMLTWGNDGMHIDWGPLSSLFDPGFFSVMADFRSALDISPKPLLTTAATWGVLTVRPAVELLNTHQNRDSMMTYELSTPWPGPVICRDTSSL